MQISSKIKAKAKQKRTNIEPNSMKNRSEIYQKSIKYEQNRKKAPKDAQERHKALGPQSSSALGAVLGHSWDAPGPLQTRPEPSKTRPGAPKCKPKAIFWGIFSHLFSASLFVSIFYEKVRNDLYRNPENINFPQENTHFHKIDFFV